MSGLTSITIPNNIISIGEAAFENCSELTSLTVPNSVSSIGSFAFRDCDNLKNVVLEDGTALLSFDVGYASDYAFANCPIESLYLGRNISFSPFQSPFKDKTTLTSITIGNSVTSIEDYIFWYCSGLTGTLTIPNSVSSIGSYAFISCSELTGITIPNSVTSIGYAAFADCSGLMSLTIPNSVSFIDTHAFYDCSGLTSLTISNSIKTIGTATFYNCSSLISLTIPESITSIGEYAFAQCTNLSEINSENPTPPQAQSNTFDAVDKGKCTLFVPAGSFTPYSQQAVWKDFLNIKEKNFGTSINTISSDTGISAYATNNGIKINGCNPMDKISIYTVTGQTVYSSVAGDGYISYPLQKGVTYVVRTPKKSLKVIY